MASKKRVPSTALEKRLRQGRHASTPLLLDLSKGSDRARLQALFTEGAVAHVRDTYEAQVRELFLIEKPSRSSYANAERAFKHHYAKRVGKQKESALGKWVFFPWISTLVHILDEPEYLRVRTSRNRGLITEEEQNLLYRGVVGIIGMSIGNSTALALALEGSAAHLRLADPDSLELSNLNRVRSGVESLGVPKVEVAARQVYLINPYADIRTYERRMTAATLDSFLSGIDVIVDECDDFALKKRLRERAAERRVAVVSGIDVGDTSVVDVERYDMSRNTKPFNDRLSAYPSRSKAAVGRAIAELVGPVHHSSIMREAHDALGDTLVSWPQLGTGAAMNGAAIATIVRNILAKRPLPSGRFITSPSATGM